ncbi:hypothetical protein R1sor_023617 [Riccia sorocarpa]|uniref:Uncharacterized protein n=1 Tax=Riccia sorocarpa TaxID=122646 RepID=A0ABD3GPN8_9MARC
MADAASEDDDHDEEDHDHDGMTAIVRTETSGRDGDRGSMQQDKDDDHDHEQDGGHERGKDAARRRTQQCSSVEVFYNTVEVDPSRKPGRPRGEESSRPPKAPHTVYSQSEDLLQDSVTCRGGNKLKAEE